MIPSFVDGLALGITAYRIPSQVIRLQGIQQPLSEMLLIQRDYNEEMQKLGQILENSSQHPVSDVTSDVITYLNSTNSASDTNVHAFSNFICSLGSTVLAITVSGRAKRLVKGTMMRRPKKFSDGHGGGTVKSTLITPAMDSKSIFKILSKIMSMEKLTDVTVVTRRIDSNDDFQLTAITLLSFVKVLNTLGHSHVCIDDINGSGQGHKKQIQLHHNNNMAIVTMHLKFEGVFSFKEYLNINDKRIQANIKFHFLPNNKRNIYVIGPNGSGKSTWGNLFIDDISNKLEVGDSIHTTLIPESIDINIDVADHEESEHKKVRLWDTPGLFDGSEEQVHMESHMGKIINQHMYFVGIILVFNGSHQSNKITLDILRYVLHTFGSRVKSSFVAIVNDKEGNAEYTYESYWDHLYEYGFKVSNDNFFIASARDQEGVNTIHNVKKKLNTFKPSYVAKHRIFFDNLSKNNGGNFTAVLKDMNTRSHEEIHQFLQNGRVRIAVNDVEGFFDGRPSAQKISLRQYETRFFFRKIGYGNKLPVDQKIIMIDESVKQSDRTSIHLMNRTTQMEQKRIFLTHILNNPSNILMTSVSDHYDFILFDYAKMNPKTKREIMEIHILRNKNFGLNAVDIQSDSNSSSS